MVAHSKRSFLLVRERHHHRGAGRIKLIVESISCRTLNEEVLRRKTKILCTDAIAIASSIRAKSRSPSRTFEISAFLYVDHMHSLPHISSYEDAETPDVNLLVTQKPTNNLECSVWNTLSRNKMPQPATRCYSKAARDVEVEHVLSRRMTVVDNATINVLRFAWVSGLSNQRSSKALVLKIPCPHSPMSIRAVEEAG